MNKYNTNILIYLMHISTNKHGLTWRNEVCRLIPTVPVKLLACFNSFLQSTNKIIVLAN